MRPPLGIRINAPSPLPHKHPSLLRLLLRIRLSLSFFLLGVINNILYVIILSAALDLVGPTSPKSSILLPNILPSLLVKLTFPYLLEHVSYRTRVVGVVVVNILGMMLVSSAPGKGSGMGWTFVGVSMASAASGAGEITFLQMSYGYPDAALASWSSGTGAAGVCGGLWYLLATNWWRVSPRVTLLWSSCLPMIMACTYFVLLPAPAVAAAASMKRDGGRQYSVISSSGQHGDDNHEEEEEDEEEEEGEVSVRDHQDPLTSSTTTTTTTPALTTRDSLRRVVRLTKPLLLPYMIPLFLVYFAEYTINQGLTPTLLFPLSALPVRRYRDIYPLYATLYQLGVFLSRSSSPFLRIRNLYPPALGQCGLLLFFAAQAMFVVVPNIYCIFVLVLVEGLFGGVVYVNAFHNVSESEAVEERDKEISIGIIGVADSFGILGAAVFSLWLETAVCGYQVSHDRPWCRME